MDFKSVDWRVLRRYLSPQAASDLNEFLEDLPNTAGRTALIAAGIAWMAAAAIGIYTMVQTQALIELRAELRETEALTPLVPSIQDVPVEQAEVAKVSGAMSAIYPGLEISQRGPSIQITARSTALFGAFREAVGHVQNGGSGWRVSVDKICVGRECPRNPLGALLRVNKVSVTKPETG